MAGLFSKAKIPLAEEMRPNNLKDVVGQEHILNKDGILIKLINSQVPSSIVFWGPAGCGKTTIAKIYADSFNAKFEQISAIFNGVADIKKIVNAAIKRHEMGELTVLFVDEIHRFNKSQQDAFLPFIENGTIILVGATTENPSFELNSALLSRVQVLTIKPLDENDLNLLLTKVEDKKGALPLTKEAKNALLNLCAGDGRYFLGLLENIYAIAPEKKLDVKGLKTIFGRKFAKYDKNGEAHFDFISTLHKAIRGSDVDGALYWFARMIEAGEDPLYIGRRLIRMASEEIAMADPNALLQCTAAVESYKQLGSPEGELMLSQAIVYLALAPKSNSVYNAWNNALATAKQTNNLEPPLFSRNAPTKLMKDMGYKKDYKYDHDSPNAFSGQNYFPEKLPRQKFYIPNQRGFEREMIKRLDFFDSKREG